MPTKPSAKSAAVEPPAAEPTRPARVQPAPKSSRRMTPALHLARDAAPYLLALTICVVSAHGALNPTAARYADELFALALILIKTSRPQPPAPPPS